jgi:hypothetical protein
MGGCAVAMAERVHPAHGRGIYEYIGSEPVEFPEQLDMVISH